MSDWISVNDRLPEEGRAVWLCNPNHGIVFVGCLCDFGDDGWCWGASNGTTYIKDGRIVAECDADDYDITHWMPLPEPPEQEKP